MTKENFEIRENFHETILAESELFSRNKRVFIQAFQH